MGSEPLNAGFFYEGILQELLGLRENSLKVTGIGKEWGHRGPEGPSPNLA